MSSRESPVGYLFSDIEESTERWEKYPTQMQIAVARHDALIEKIVSRHSGVIQDRAGDGVFATFRTGNPLQCALDIQLEMQRNDWSAVGGLFVRLGVHAGLAADTSLIDRAVANRTYRIMSSGWGGQIVISNDASQAYATPPDGELIDLGHCRFKGIDEPLRLFSLIHPRLQRTEFPPLRSILFHGLSGPDLAGPMFGRQRELGEVLARLVTRRLVTIVGPGGNGKTRLAAQVGAKYAAKWPVCFVSLESVTNGEELVSAVARALRFTLHGAMQPEEQLINYLRDKQLLLVLDNAEAIAGKALFIESLNVACPQLTILITSREPLQLAGESLFRLPGLPAPGPDPGEVVKSSALQLFLHEAKLKDETFDLSITQANTFREICELVDGSPLALRLTAQWAQALSLEEILERLHDSVDFLSASDRRHDRHTVRGVFEGSWKLLDVPQRKALARLSVFARAFDWAAASRVADLDLDTFGALERKGLLEQTADRRFVMHTLVRAYAREKLADDVAEEADTRRQHSAYYLGLVCSGLANMAARGQGAVLEGLQRDFAEIHAAWFYAVGANAKPLILRTIEPLCCFLYTRSMFRDALAVFAAPTADESLKRYFASIRASFLVHQGDAKTAAIAAAGVLAVPGGPRGARAHAHHTLGNLAHMRGDFVQAKSHYKRAIAIREKAGDLMGSCYTAISLAALHVMFDRLDDARQYVKRGFVLARQIGDTFGVMASHVYAGDIAACERRFDSAQENYETALRLEESIPNPQFRSMLHRRLGSLFLAQGDPEGALKRHSEAYELAHELGDQRSRTHALIEIGNDLRLMGDHVPAKSALLRGIRLSMALGMQPILMRGLLELAHVELRLGNMGAAQRLAGVLNRADLRNLHPTYDALIAELDGGEPAPVAATTVQDLLNEIIAEAEVDSLRLKEKR